MAAASQGLKTAAQSAHTTRATDYGSVPIASPPPPSSLPERSHTTLRAFEMALPASSPPRNPPATSASTARPSRAFLFA